MPGLFPAGPPGKPQAPAPGAPAPGRRSAPSQLLEPLLLLPPALVAVAVVAAIGLGIGQLWRPWGLFVPFVTWWLPAPVIAVPALRRRSVARWHRLREPTEREEARLLRPWSAVLGAAGLTGRRHPLLVARSPVDDPSELCGLAALALDRDEVEYAGEGRLRGLLAHALGHQLRRDHVTAFLQLQLTLPTRLLRSCASALWRVVRRAHRNRGPLLDPAEVLTVVIAAVAALLACAVLAVPAAVAWAVLAPTRFGRTRAEFEADDAAVELGFGPELLTALQTDVELSEEPRPGWRTPLIERRVARLRARLGR